MSEKTIGRRRFLKLSALTAVSAALAACGATPTATPVPPTATKPPAATAVPPTAVPPTAVPAAPTATKAAAAATAVPPTAVPPTAVPAAAAKTYQESPMLADLVKAGKLPAVALRLPANPRVITVKDKIGTFGGTWHRAYKGLSDRWGPTKLMEEHVMQWQWQGSAPVTVVNTVEKWEQNADASEFTFYMRKGMKWSDGSSFDTNDVKFWYEDFYMNKDLNTDNFGTSFDNADKTPMQITIVDQYTFKVTYKKPKPLMAILMAKSGTNVTQCGPDFALPSAYMKQWHIKYGDKAKIDAKVAEFKLGSWTELWNSSNGIGQGQMYFWFLNPDRPTINAWKVVNPPPADPETEERNPYFFKVDSAGNQLPYIDKIEHALFSDQQVFNLWLISGKIDMQFRNTDPGSYTLYKENEAKGGYKVQKNISASVSAVYPNINNPDPVLAKLFDTPDFRHALSISINRKEINDLIYSGLQTPMQACPVHGSPNFDAEFVTKWAEYDVKTANSLLDGLGLKMGPDGKTRLRPDGKPLQFVLESQDTPGSPDLDQANQIVKYWQAIGLGVTYKNVERTLYTTHYQNGDIDVGRWGMDRNSIVMADPGRYIAATDDGPWAPLYGHWYIKSIYKQLEPPADHPIRKIWAAWDATQIEPDETKRNAVFKTIIDTHKANPWVIGTVGESPALWIVKNTFHNVPQGYIEDDTLRDYGVAEPWQFWMDKA